ncbi:MAG: FAD-dependent monooxygenase, partial [Acidobacteriota bacterium]
VPFYGQGANAAFEDTLFLAQALEASPAQREQAFIDYEERRLTHAWTLADLSLANFIEMRDKTSSRLFLSRKLLERVLHRLFPGVFVPLYSLVTFSRLPYAEAVRRSRRQWGAVLSLVSGAVLLVLMILFLALGKSA